MLCKHCFCWTVLMQLISISDSEWTNNKEKIMIESNVTGTIYSIYHWADVPESENTYWSGLGSGKEYRKHPLPHASPSEVRDSCCVGFGWFLVGFVWFFSHFTEQCFFTYLCLKQFCIMGKQAALIMWIFLCLRKNFRLIVNTFFPISKTVLSFD